MNDLINKAFQAALEKAEPETLKTFLFQLNEANFNVRFSEDMSIDLILHEINDLNRHENVFTTVNFLANLVNLIGEENA